MKNAKLIARFALFAIAASGCTPSPSEVCAKMDSLLSAEGKDRAGPECVVMAQKAKEKNKPRYECIAKGTMDAKTLKESWAVERACVEANPDPAERVGDPSKAFGSKN